MENEKYSSMWIFNQSKTFPSEQNHLIDIIPRNHLISNDIHMKIYILDSYIFPNDKHFQVSIPPWRTTVSIQSKMHFDKIQSTNSNLLEFALLTFDSWISNQIDLNQEDLSESNLPIVFHQISQSYRFIFKKTSDGVNDKNASNRSVVK